ncbi:MAG: hypothetical protein K0R57_6092 [Paenibacillaceae bacterium]|jgi:hypothetical protein|nr:hypothetical protein [Paenibacillaceae bacterium]
MEVIEWLQQWYQRQCDGEWEHLYGIKISTLDNPGWYVEINLEETSLSKTRMEYLRTERSEMDWCHYKIEKNIFIGAGGPNNLCEILTYFRKLTKE